MVSLLVSEKLNAFSHGDIYSCKVSLNVQVNLLNLNKQFTKLKFIAFSILKNIGGH